MEEKNQGAAAPRIAPIPGRCICDHYTDAHTRTDHVMERMFPGQRWNGCVDCGCPFFRQEDEIAVGLRDGSIRIVFPEGEPQVNPSKTAPETMEQHIARMGTPFHSICSECPAPPETAAQGEEK